MEKVHIICDQCGDDGSKEQISRLKLVKHGEKSFYVISVMQSSGSKHL